MAHQRTTSVTIYKDTLYAILQAHNTTASEMSKRLGFDGSYLAQMFSKGGGEYAPFSPAVAVAICALLAIKQEDLLKAPYKPKAIPIAETRDRIPNANTVTKEDLAEVVKQLDATIKAATNLLHQDLLALLKEWRPKVEPPRIGGENSK